LRAPPQSFQIGVFTLHRGTPIGLAGFALQAPFFLFTLFHLLGFFAIALGNRRFSWSSDGFLLPWRN
jgi:hypothetical protein